MNHNNIIRFRRILTALLFTTFGGLWIGIGCQSQAQSTAGIYPVGTEDLRFEDRYYTKAPVKMRVFFPASPDGKELADGKFPIVAFGHGFVMNYLVYTNIFNHLASWGYIVAVPDEQNGFNVNHYTFAQQLSACVRYLQDQGKQSDSQYFNKTDSTSAVLGHSMGGGASMLAPLIYPQLTAIAGLAPAQTNSNPTAIDGLKQIQTPLLIISSRGDSVTPERNNQIPMFDNALGPKQRVSLLKGGHCNFSDGPNLACNFGATTAGDKGTLSNAEQQFLARRYLTAFFNYHLKNDRSALTFICGDSVKTDIQVENFTNITCPTGGIDSWAKATERKKFNLIPNPSEGTFWITGLYPAVRYHVLDLNGKTVYEFQGEDFSQIIDLSHLPDGLYLIKNSGLGMEVSKKIMILR